MLEGRQYLRTILASVRDFIALSAVLSVISNEQISWLYLLGSALVGLMIGLLQVLRTRGERGLRRDPPE